VLLLQSDCVASAPRIKLNRKRVRDSQSERKRAGAEQGFLYYSLSLSLRLCALPAPSLLLWGCSRFNCYEICKSRKRSRRCHVKAYVRVTAIIGKQGAPHSEAAGCALSLWGIRPLCSWFDGNPTRTESMREFQLSTPMSSDAMQ
jgi:hypothetical protein